MKHGCSCHIQIWWTDVENVALGHLNVALTTVHRLYTVCVCVCSWSWQWMRSKLVVWTTCMIAASRTKCQTWRLLVQTRFVTSNPTVWWVNPLLCSSLSLELGLSENRVPTGQEKLEKVGEFDWSGNTHTHNRLMALCQTFFYQLLPCTVIYSILLIDQGKSGIAHCFLDMWQQLNEYLIFCQTLNSMWNVHGKKIKSVGTKSFEMIKSACRGKLCWCCKLLCAFSTEMCSGSGIDQGMLYDWLKLLCWHVHMHANRIICFHLAIQPFHVPLV